MQLLLAGGGWSPGWIDGVYGRRTRSAIIACQKALHQKPDGLIEPQGMTWHLLTDPEHRRTHYLSLDYAHSVASAVAREVFGGGVPL